MTWIGPVELQAGPKKLFPTQPVGFFRLTTFFAAPDCNFDGPVSILREFTQYGRKNGPKFEIT